jgi:chaperonin GroEL
VELSNLGTCKKVEILKNLSTFVAGKGDYQEVERRIENLKIEFEQTDSLHACERIQERITRLASGVAIIRVGAATEIEMVEKKHRIEDALEAVRAAQLDGIVPGGGVALVRAIPKQKLWQPYSSIVYEAATEPLRQMALNAGESPDVILDKVQRAKSDKGWDFKDGVMTSMLEAGIIDPVKVTITALVNAVSAAGTLITTDHAIIEEG